MYVCMYLHCLAHSTQHTILTSAAKFSVRQPHNKYKKFIIKIMMMTMLMLMTLSVSALLGNDDDDTCNYF